MPTIHIVHHGSGQQNFVRGIDMNLMPSASESEGGEEEEEELELAGRNLQLSAISELDVHKPNQERELQPEGRQDGNQMKKLSENLSNQDRDWLGKVSNQDRAWLRNVVSNRDQDWAGKVSNRDRDRDWLRTIISNRDQNLARKVSNEDRDWLGHVSSRDEVQPTEVFDRDRPEIISEVIMGIYNERLRNGGEYSRGRGNVDEEEEIEFEGQNVYGKIHHKMKVPDINENQGRNGGGNYHRLVSVVDLIENRDKDQIPNGNHHKFVPENDQDVERMGSEGNVSRGSDEELDMGGGIRKKLRLSKEQSALLEESFKEQSTLNPKQKNALARRLNLRARQVEVWFQNRRARTKLKKTEVDCELLKRCCESLTEENRRLQKEVAELRALKMMSDSPTTSAGAGGVAPHHDFYRKPLPATTLRICASCEKPSPPHASLMPRKSPFAITINSMDMDMDMDMNMACPSLKTTPHFNLSMSPKQQSSAAIC